MELVPLKGEICQTTLTKQDLFQNFSREPTPFLYVSASPSRAQMSLCNVNAVQTCCSKYAKNNLLSVGVSCL